MTHKAKTFTVLQNKETPEQKCVAAHQLNILQTMQNKQQRAHSPSSAGEALSAGSNQPWQALQELLGSIKAETPTCCQNNVDSSTEYPVLLALKNKKDQRQYHIQSLETEESASKS